jgi:hypothetical protein
MRKLTANTILIYSFFSCSFFFSSCHNSENVGSYNHSNNKDTISGIMAHNLDSAEFTRAMDSIFKEDLIYPDTIQNIFDSLTPIKYDSTGRITEGYIRPKK